MLKNILCATSLLCAATFANAATITFNDTVTLKDTNFSESVALTKFDTMGGTRTLTSVKLSLLGSIAGVAEVESRDAGPATLTTTLTAELKLSNDANLELLSSTPSVSRVFMASAFDSVVDFGGTSGTTYNDLAASDLKDDTYGDAATLAYFTGTGTANFMFDTLAASKVEGNGNIVSGLSTQASALVTVIYTFTESPVSVSAPSHLALLGLGLVGFAGLRKIRK